MSIDCLFDMLDYFQWKYNERCWQSLSELLTNSNKMYFKIFFFLYKFNNIFINKKEKFFENALEKIGISVLAIGNHIILNT